MNKNIVKQNCKKNHRRRKRTEFRRFYFWGLGVYKIYAICVQAQIKQKENLCRKFFRKTVNYFCKKNVPATAKNKFGFLW
ncbi:MAG: hypothetical protein EOM28_04100 [Clostridia bacterium]|nr:hypothetical protein [Clostridia bacterium]